MFRCRTVTTIPRVSRNDLSNPPRSGFSENFLGVGMPLPGLSPAVLVDALSIELGGATTMVIPYEHFSLVMSASRKLAIYSAVNIDQTKKVTLPPRSDDIWEFDHRIPLDAQTGNPVYTHWNADHGHLVRRLDPVWGDTQDEAARADLDTFHFTNCAPQSPDFNRGKKVWAGLEDYILGNADLYDLKVSVINGPVFRPDDPIDSGVAVPLEFWKVVATRKADGNLSATAYVLSQKPPVPRGPEALPPWPPGFPPLPEFTFGAYRTFQTSVEEIELATGLTFGDAASHDPYVPPTKADGRQAPPGKPGHRKRLSDTSQIVV